MNFLFDNNLPVPLAQAMRLLGKSVSHVQDIHTLGKRAPDDLIMQYAAEHRYFVVTRDLDQVSYPWFKPTLLSLGGGYFFVRAATRPGKEPRAWQLVQKIVKAWDEIERYAATHKVPFTAIVKPGGGVSKYK